MRKSHKMWVAIFWVALFGLLSWAGGLLEAKQTDTVNFSGVEIKQTDTVNLAKHFESVPDATIPRPAEPGSWSDRSIYEKSESPVTKTMVVESTEGKLSGLTFIRGDTAFVMIYYSISGEDSRKVWQDLQIIETMPNVKKIKVYLDCWGGDAYSGFAIADNFSRMKNKYEISVHASGVVASAAVIVFASFDIRYASPNCFFMVHEAAIPSSQGMDKSDVKIMDKLMDKLEKLYLNILIKNSNLSNDEWQDKIEKTTWFSADEAKKWGLVTEVR